MNHARYFLPHILALSTNSPFWLGMNTGLKSYRCKVFDKFPRTNIPDYFPSWGEYDSFIKLLIKTNCIDNAKKIWWDIRPHPFFDTLEFRVCDIPMRVDETIALAALIQATIAKLYKLYAANQGFRLYRRALIMENKWRAARYGLDGKLIDFGKQKEVPVRDLIHEYLDFIDDVVDELDSREELKYLRQILETGSGADRQLRVFQETGDLKNLPVTQTNHQLSTLTFDPVLTPGARNAVNVCLRIQPNEKVTTITDDATKEIAASIVRELEQLGSTYRAWVLDDLAPRPLRDLPQEIADNLETSEASIFAVQAQANELRSRMQMTDIVNRRHIRHAHMVNINRQIMLEGMRADFLKVDRISQKVAEMVRRASLIRAKTAAGTDLTAELNPSYRWIKTSGIISPEKWGNLPGGEGLTTPGEGEGPFVIDGVVGYWLCAKFGDLAPKPLTIRIKNNRLTEAHSANHDLEDDFWRYTHTDENSDRVGEFAIGTNIELKDVIGQILQDEKYPGVHIAFGNPYGAHTGAEWYSSTHIDVVGRKFDIWVDDEQIMKNGKFLIEA